MHETGDRVQNIFTGKAGTIVTGGGCPVVDLDDGTRARGDFRAWVPFVDGDPPLAEPVPCKRLAEELASAMTDCGDYWHVPHDVGQRFVDAILYDRT